MKWLGPTLLAALSAACVAVFPAATPLPREFSRPDTTLLTVVTWNMGAGRGDLAALLDEHVGTPFVALLQECDAAPLAELTAARGLSMFHAPIQPGAPERRGNAIVSTLPLREARLIPLPRERQPRTAVAASIDVAGVPLFVVSTHLENRVSWWRGGLLSEEARGRQAEALIDALPAGAFGILGGDINTWLGEREPAWQLLLRRFPDTPEPRPRTPTFRERLVLDHLFYNLPPGWSARTRVVWNRFGSDHLPVVGVVVRQAAPD